ncbi:dihydrodipicolinate synthase family protein [Planococcus sp. CPCC 101016]|uniref:dihydrodipicolinate synthase family protein n=1 Tax=Planococcus sp. CPCC 101016 TaxID=2599617 RepID=UPI0011B63119|nr:dihydrodipicolinate synthase family protein [Planococcus sp. CPCC 101016]TWT06474.1 dihydrodipicolinate synthase family protein [Planococcus sp. CPCC 101016]
MKFKGIIPPVVTLFDAGGNLDLDLNRRYLELLLQSNIHGILLTGSSGEFTSLTMDERKLYVKEMIKTVDNRVPVLVGIGHTVMKDVLELCAHAEENGADGVLAVSPYYWPLSEDQLFNFYSIIAENTKLPVLLYNIPSLTGQSLSVELVKRLVTTHPNICGIKETVSEISHLRQMIIEVARVKEDFMVFSAFDEHLLPALMIGSAGSINGTAVFVPEISVGLFEDYQQGNLADAEKKHQKLSLLMEIYTLCPSYFTSMKEAVHQRWFSEKAGHRAPFDVYPSDLSEKVSSLLAEAGPMQNQGKVDIT